jgi:hypothetical protein
MSDLYYKLTSDELPKLSAAGLLSVEDAVAIMESSAKRPDGEFNENMVRIYLNKQRSVWVQSIHSMVVSTSESLITTSRK